MARVAEKNLVRCFIMLSADHGVCEKQMTLSFDPVLRATEYTGATGTVFLTTFLTSVIKNVVKKTCSKKRRLIQTV